MRSICVWGGGVCGGVWQALAYLTGVREREKREVYRSVVGVCLWIVEVRYNVYGCRYGRRQHTILYMMLTIEYELIY